MLDRTHTCPTTVGSIGNLFAQREETSTQCSGTGDVRADRVQFEGILDHISSVVKRVSKPLGGDSFVGPSFPSDWLSCGFLVEEAPPAEPAELSKASLPDGEPVASWSHPIGRPALQKSRSVRESG